MGRPCAYAPPGYRARLRAALRRVAGTGDDGWQHGAARRLGVSDGVVSLWARGIKTPSMHNLVRLSGLSGVNLHWLLTGVGPIAAPGEDVAPDAEAEPGAAP